MSDTLSPKLEVWGLDGIDPAAIVQAERTSRLPFVDRVALMPDAHVGIGATVGSVVATRDAIIPAAVGVDIGCGMAAARLNLTATELPDDLGSLMPGIEKAIPAGVGVGNAHATRTAHVWWDLHADKFTHRIATEATTSKRAVEQLGSLGSGNHFFEVCLDESDAVWVVLHSGSRGLGNKIGTAYIDVARKLRGDQVEDCDLAWFGSADVEFGMYLGDMLLCQDYARVNREVMLQHALGAVDQWLGRTVGTNLVVNCHHNFAAEEDGRWVTRKGAIAARDGQLGIIPGSMGTRSYIVRGRGSDASMHSCSHGAGRRLSRGAARREHSADQLAELMVGKVWNADKAASLVDEIPHAYKDIDHVMAAQADLVEPLHTLRQILNYKGA